MWFVKPDAAQSTIWLIQTKFSLRLEEKEARQQEQPVHFWSIYIMRPNT